jgi:hypothetical protein
VLVNYYINPGGNLPAYPRLRTMLLIGAGGAALAATSSVAKGWFGAEDLRKWTPDVGYPPQCPSEQAYVESRQNRNHICVITGAGLGLAVSLSPGWSVWTSRSCGEGDRGRRIR